MIGDDKEGVIKVLKFQASNHDINARDALKVIQDQQTEIENYKVYINRIELKVESIDEKLKLAIEVIASKGES